MVRGGKKRQNREKNSDTKKNEGDQKMEAVLRVGRDTVSKASAKSVRKSCVEELAEWGYDIARKKGLTKEDSRKLLEEARKILDESGH